MANKENQPPRTPQYADQCTPPGSASSALGLRPWQTTAFASPPFRAISPNSKPSLVQQRDHSGCRRADTPLKVRKTRENLRQDAIHTDVPPPCLHLSHDREGDDGDDSQQQSHVQVPAKHAGVHHTHGYSEACASSLPSLPPFHLDDFHPLMSVPPSIWTQPSLPAPPRMQRHRSVSRRMLSKVKQGIASRTKTTPTGRSIESETSLVRRISGRRKQSVEVERRAQNFEVSRDSVASVVGSGSTEESLNAHNIQRSDTQPTISTTEVLGDLSSRPNDPVEPNYAWTPQPGADKAIPESRKDPTLTARPLQRSLPGTFGMPHNACVPCINVTVTLDRIAVDAGTEQQVWTALEASVVRRACSRDQNTLEEGLDDANNMLGTITSLRLCFKPVDGCSIIELIGQKGFKNLTADQTCSLFIKVQVPQVRSASTAYAEDDQASLFADLESMVGTLQTELLHLEVRYRHSLLPYDNVVAVKHVAKVTRPKLDSRWSMISGTDGFHMAEQLHTKLAIYIADHYAPARALKLIDRCLAAEVACEEPVKQIRATVAAELKKASASDHEVATQSRDKPSVVVTDIDIDSSLASAPAASKHYPTAPCTPVEFEHQDEATPLLAAPAAHGRARSVSMNMLATHEHAAIAASREHSDDARKIWRHIRRSSLTAKQLAEIAPEQLQKLEMSDQALMELRQRALANKRSVGAETLKAWQWDEKALKQRGEMPWM